MIDLKALEYRVERLLKNETKESLTKWIVNKRKAAINSINKNE